jgi:hypothetical protein
MANAAVLKTAGLRGPCRFESCALRRICAIRRNHRFGAWTDFWTRATWANRIFDERRRFAVRDPGITRRCRFECNSQRSGGNRLRNGCGPAAG